MNLFSTLYPSPIGNLKIQCTATHITSVLFNDEPADFKNEYHTLLQLCIDQFNEYFAGKRKAFHLPLNQTGTDFQQKVWELLYQIPYGKIISYQQLSKQYGDVKAIRAIASANGKNNLPIIVPCHRVIGSNQSLTGYSGGLWRKQWLLEHEAKFHSGVQQLF
jgi:methylated-DNA-[protein]-cysteine S-methyltransferase